MYQDLTTTAQRMNRPVLKPATWREWLSAFTYAMLGLPALYVFVVIYSLLLK